MKEKMTAPKVSAIIPTYNEERYISKCLDSLLAQDYEDLEIIVVDDGSTDKTAEIVEEYVKKHDKIKLIGQGHRGPGAARNRGAEIAKGEILVLVDADMTFEKNYIFELTKPIRDGEAEETAHGKEIVANTGSIISRCWGAVKVAEEFAKPSKIPRAILRDKFLKAGGYDPSKGYWDDGTLYPKTKTLAKSVPTAVCYHYNPDTLSETFSQAKWIGHKVPIQEEKISLIYNLAISSILLLPLLSLYSRIFVFSYFIFLLLVSARKTLQTKKYLKTLFFEDVKLFVIYPIYRIVYSVGYVIGFLLSLVKD
jgi:glycosyltransferase involved in cell wall biosynthesis